MYILCASVSFSSLQFSLVTHRFWYVYQEKMEKKTKMQNIIAVFDFNRPRCVCTMSNDHFFCAKWRLPMLMASFSMRITTMAIIDGLTHLLAHSKKKKKQQIDDDTFARLQFCENYPMKLNYPFVLCLVRWIRRYEEPLCREWSTFHTHYVICVTMLLCIAFFFSFSLFFPESCKWKTIGFYGKTKQKQKW